MFKRLDDDTVICCECNSCFVLYTAKVEYSHSTKKWELVRFVESALECASCGAFGLIENLDVADAISK